jgi:hypothetical protein
MQKAVATLALLCLCATAGFPQVAFWKMGGSGLDWAANDTSNVFIDFERDPGAIQPVFLTKDFNILSSRSDWSPFKFPTDLGYEDGAVPRIWRAANGFYWFTAGVITPAWVDGDSLSYSPPVSRGLTSEWYTIDVGVPVPADQFNFFTPPTGFRADGTLLRNDIVKAFEVSVSPEADPVLNQEEGDGDYHRLRNLIADVPQNFDPEVNIRFQKQYVRFIRYKRNESIDDTQFAAGQNNQQSGTIGEFILLGEGVPKRVNYTSKILDLGREVNFGRIFWSATPMRMIDGVATPVEDAKTEIQIIVRSGRDEDPNIYHEFTDTGDERIVTRARFENDLKQPDQASGGQIQEGKPGLRASIQYDTNNWTFWSFPLTQSGQQTPLQRSRFIQLRADLESGDFFDFVRLDSVWIETSPPLAGQILGEVAAIDDPQPARGFTEVELGAMTDFAYDIRADFSSSQQLGFDAVSISTGGPAQFRRLEMGDPLVEVTPVSIEEEAGRLTVLLPQRITRTRNQPLRLVFGAEVFVFANTFDGQVFDSQSGDLPQPVEAGDVSDALGTNSLQILGATGQAGSVIDNLRLSTPVLTPNGDQVNDRMSITYELFRLPTNIPVELNVYSLDGSLQSSLDLGLQGAGTHEIFWDGRDAAGDLLTPGLYLLDLSIKAESETFRNVRPVGVAY